MKRRHVIINSLIFVCLMLFSAGTVYQFMTGNSPLATLRDAGHRDDATLVVTKSCSPKAPIAGLSNAKSPSLKKLAIYQEACHSFATSTMMIFVGMPVSAQSAAQNAQTTSVTLKEFAHYGIRPLVMAEPTNYANGVNIDFGKVAAGQYTSYIDDYFKDLQATGITDQEMGIWNPFPEANLPYWSNNQPQYFAPDVNIYVSTLHKYFPTAQASIMLNAASYQTTDFNWQNGNYESLLPYVKGITPGSITYVGLEGFPWIPPQGQASTPILNAATFLNSSIIEETAAYMKVKNIWFNTGTFSEKYALDPNSIAYLNPQQRAAILTTVDGQALALTKQGFNVSVNLFSQNKTESSEETNWSYWSNNQPFTSRTTPVLTQFITELNQQHIGFWLFDE
jgi:hypothetical protein